MKGPIKNMAASVRQRLADLKDRTGSDFNRLLNDYAIERFLYRLSQSRYAGEFILKGARLFTLWQGAPHRETRDVDLLGFGEPSLTRLATVTREICATAVADDGVTFGKVRTELIRADQEYGGVRVLVEGRLGQAIIPMSIDVGFGDEVTPIPATVDFPTLLGFPKPRLRVYPVETVVAEKLHASVLLGIANSRMKDFFDLWYLGRAVAFDGRILTKAIGGTFARRATPIPHETPVALTAEFWNHAGKRQQWAAFRRANVRIVVPEDFGEVVQFIDGWLLVPLRAARDGIELPLHWAPGGPWR